MKVNKIISNAAFALLSIPAMSYLHQSFRLRLSRTSICQLIHALPAWFSCTEAVDV